MRSCVDARSYGANAPQTRNRNAPCGVVVSICSVSERNATPRSFRLFTVASRWGSDRSAAILAAIAGNVIKSLLIDELGAAALLATMPSPTRTSARKKVKR